MTYLITGHKGFIGTNLTYYLQSKIEEVIGIDYYDGDLCKGIPSSIKNLSIHTIVHLAAETNVRDSIANPSKCFLRNCQSTTNILEFASAKKAKLIFISSCGACRPSSPYTASKIAGEAICRAYKSSYDSDIVILRLPNIYGPYSDHKTSVIPAFIKSKLLGREVTIYGDGNQKRDFVYVKDICRAIYTADRDKQLTSGRLTSINEIANLIGCKATHSKPIQGEIDCIGSFTNISPEHSLEHNLKETIEWFKNFYRIDN